MIAERTPSEHIGHARPRIAPPLPLRHGLADYRRQSADLGIVPMPWQETAARYVTALGPDDRWLYRDVAIVVARQNGKTTLTKPLIVARLKAGRHIMHIAQKRELPRIMFEAIADALEQHPELFARRRGKIIWPRRGAGSESIVLTNGGSYRIAAAIAGSSRGHSMDDLLIDELREMETWDVINSAKPAQRFSENPQTIYLSNMGTEQSVVLNSLRTRAFGDDPSLAYLEWSADPKYDTGDLAGWLQANPAISPEYPQVLRDLETDYVAAKIGGNLAGFETEALCRLVPSTRQRLVDEFAWAQCQRPLGDPRQPVMAVSMTPDGTRAAAAVAWQLPDGSIGLRLIEDAIGSPIDVKALGEAIDLHAKKLGAVKVGMNPLTDAELAKHLRKPVKITGTEYANASAQFVNLVNAGRIHWQDAEAVTDDLAWTARKDHDDTGHFQAVRMSDDHPIPAALAAIRAVWLASGPSTARARIY
jgi:hypothetical protein